MENLNRYEAYVEHLENEINKNKNDMYYMTILWHMSNNGKYEELNKTQKYCIMEFIYKLYMKDETFTDLGRFSDLVMDNYNEILNGTMSKTDIYNLM